MLCQKNYTPIKFTISYAIYESIYSVFESPLTQITHMISNEI